MDNGRPGNELRIGDPEREQAMRLLGEHFSAGRLDVAEYDQRCRQAGAARFGSDLAALFDDLPEPRPTARPPAPSDLATPRPARQTKIAIAVGAVALAVLLVVFARQLGFLLLVPAVAFLWFSWRR